MLGDGASAFVTVSLGVGADLVIALQPGFAKIRIKANTWMPTTMPKTFRIFIGVSVGGLREFKLSQIRRGPELARKALELVAAVLVIAELVEAREAGTQQHLVTGHRQLGRATHRLVERGAQRVGDAKRGAVKRELGARLADEHGVLHLGRDAVHEAREVAALALAAGDQDHGPGKTGQRRLD